MVFTLIKKERITGGKEYVIENIANTFVKKICIPTYKVNSIEDIKNEIIKFYNIDKKNIVILGEV